MYTRNLTTNHHSKLKSQQLNHSSITMKTIQSNDTLQRFHFKGIGTILGMISGTFYSFSGLFTKLLTGKVDPIFISWVRSTFIFVVFSVLCLFLKRKFWIYGLRDHLYLAAAGFVGAAVCVLQCYTFQLIYLSDAITIISSSPVFVAILSYVILKEKLDKVDVFVMVICLVGVCLCVQPHFLGFSGDQASGNYLGEALAVLTAFGWAVNMIIIRKVAHVDLLVILSMDFFYSCVMQTLFMFPFQNYSFNLENLSWGYVFANSLASLSACLFLSSSLKIDSPYFTAIGRTAEIIVGMILNVTVFGVEANWMSIFGGILVMSGIIMMSIYKAIGNQNYDSIE